MTEGKGLDENQTDEMMRFNENTSWFGHLALCIVLRHHFFLSSLLDGELDCG